MATLHILANPAAQAACLRAVAPADWLLLLGDGARAMGAAAGVHAARIGVLAEDAPTRSALSDQRLERLSYAGFVDWVVACERSVTWT